MKIKIGANVRRVSSDGINIVVDRSITKETSISFLDNAFNFHSTKNLRKNDHFKNLRLT